MPEDPKKILKKYWGYEQFRPFQEPIIQSVLDGHDTMALLTTGGGKSICFQVPALCQEGICIVISPLIALMKDQVENLKRKGIAAIAIYSGMSKREIDIALDNCIYGAVKFLYVSPERIKTPLFLARLDKMNVNLIAVDEAHCISQWGYDFRPPYLEIASLRNKLKVPFLALTATATPRVVEDIQEKLAFKEKRVFKAPYARPNLRYFVSNNEDKFTVLMSVVNKQKGSGIIYVRSRRLTLEIAQYLNKRAVSADFYHAGLSVVERSAKQMKWVKGQTRIIVSTNAFGMGIDKPDVRFVVNIDLPECIEAYYQEAGRGGRDEKKAFAVLLIDDADQEKLLKNAADKFPAIETIKSIYGILCNHLRLAIGSGYLETYPIVLSQFEEQNTQSKSSVKNSLLFLQRAGYIQFSEGVFQQSKLKFEADNQQLYALQVSYPIFDKIIKVLLRSYTGLFDVFITINEKEIAKRADLSEMIVKKSLKELQDFSVVTYIPASNADAVTFLQPRIDTKNLRIDPTIYQNLKDITFENAKAMIRYAYSNNVCRSVFLLDYFGEKNTLPCGVCDVCLVKNASEKLDKIQFQTIELAVKNTVKVEKLTFEELVDKLAVQFSKKSIKFVARWLLDNDELHISSTKIIELYDI